MGRKTKAQIIAVEAEEKSKDEKKRIIQLLVDSGQYHQALDPIIETYIEAFEIHYVMYRQWKDSGFKATKQYTNKAGARNEIKNPLAQQVEVWNQKKAKYLNQLGLDNKNKDLIYKTGIKLSADTTETEEKQNKENSGNNLVNFRKKFGR
ncbi:P27 family phage terminase small subunit [Macrococcus capreoli]|uniref:P27 family phage terminase small subunit n=1 Tax=Macrococcus capreoli TaxID=2982690 RepID=UPI003F4298B9